MRDAEFPILSGIIYIHYITTLLKKYLITLKYILDSGRNVSSYEYVSQKWSLLNFQNSVRVNALYIYLCGEDRGNGREDIRS
jgi:hypothetical protein